ncbi:MAG: hypothetical protein KatS3mg003_0957 [Candidatus Nitrosocaldaceae archaeon]|nr:MAG: hypothetical protein KatS3mg003_0957 [Candidatus Nitrosocaldaceae archaeon]
MKVCSFCNTKIDEGESICSNCMKRYGINAMISLEDGCSCDTK